jgi:2-hydroxy-3-keto-5-methylthiopentenyl-1-phosphate phosphatase
VGVDAAGGRLVMETRAEPTDVRPAVPPLRDGDVPLSILIDYDGTISLTDVTDVVMAEHLPGNWEESAALYDAGEIGSRSQMVWELEEFDTEPELLFATAAAQPHDPGFVPFIRRAQAASIPVEVVSDGFGFFIRPALERLGVGEVTVVTSRTVFAGRSASIEFPNGHPRCFVCGTCKRERVFAHRATGRRVMYIGDGESDRYAAGYSDVVFAKRSLERICIEAGWPFHRWTTFSEIDTWLAATLASFERDPSTLAPAATEPTPRGFFCGPEAWGEGLTDPPEGTWPPTYVPG